MASKNIGEYELMLNDLNFIRVHHSYMINIDHVSKFNKSDSSLTLSDGTVVVVSQRKKERLIQQLTSAT